VATTNPNALPPIPQDEIKENPRWREWFRNLGTYIQQAQTGNTVWSILQGGTGASTATGARANLGLGSMAVENSNNVSITGGTISGVAITGSTIPYSNVTGTGGITRTITTAKLTSGGTNGSMTFTNGILTASTQAT
jgi:hypothetical protein